MMRQALIAAAILAAGLAHGQAIIANRTAAGGIDVDTANVITVMPESLWAQSVMFWPMSKAAPAGTYYDYSPRTRDGSQGTAGSRPTWSDVGLGCYSFDGDWIDCGSTNMPATNNFTASVWVRPASTAQVAVIAQRIGVGGNGRTQIMRYNDHLAAFLGDQGAHPSVFLWASNAANTVWHYIVLTRSNVTFRLYYNGRLADTRTDSGLRTVLQVPTVLGFTTAHSASYLPLGANDIYYSGLIDCPVIANDCWSSETITNEFARQRRGKL